MKIETADEIIEFFRDFNAHFKRMISFLSEKENRILKDDIVWLSDSLTQEQALVMTSTRLEDQRLSLFEEKGYKDYKSEQIINEMPPERQALMRLECDKLADSIFNIKKINIRSLDLVERKLTVLAKAINAPEFTSVDTYTENCEKIKHSVGDIIGSV